jgi:drug/metabolite transporter (DMT)-like permease
MRRRYPKALARRNTHALVAPLFDAAPLMSRVNVGYNGVAVKSACSVSGACSSSLASFFRRGFVPGVLRARMNARVPPSSPPAPPRLKRSKVAHIPASAVALIVIAVLCFSILDGIIKSLAARYPVTLLVWARWSLQAVGMLLWLGPTMGRALFRTEHLRIHVLRGAILVASSICFVNALRFLPLADATAINYSTPTVVVILAVAFLREKMTRPRIAFIVAGIVGMALIVRPGAAIFHGAALLAMGAAACYAVFQILTRKLAGEDSRVLLMYPALVGALLLTFALPTLTLPDQLPWRDIALLIVGGAIGTAGHFLFILAFQRAPASGLTPFTYMQLVWGTLVGWIVFDDFPDRLTLIGMGIIGGSGLLLTWHERRQALGQSREPAAIG